MSKHFLNFFFRYSGFVFNAKRRIVEADKWHRVAPWAVLLFFSELGFIVASLPFYFFVSPKKLQERGFIFPSAEEDAVHFQHFIMRRKISLAAFFGAGGVWVFKLAMLAVVSYFYWGAQPLLADTQTWTFSTPSDYTYNSSTIEFSGGNAQLKDLGSVFVSSTINSNLTTNATGWTYADWTDPANVVVGGTRQTSGGNTGPYLDVNIDITGSGSKNRTGAGYWRQPFITNSASPDIATLNLDWSSITYTAPGTPITYQLYVFIETTSGAPASTSTAVWNSGEITGTTSWASISTTSIVSKIPTAGTYYLKIAAYATSPTVTGSYSLISGFDNIIVNWSKTTSVFATSSPTTTPVTSLSATKVIRWNSFTETAVTNGGSINYQLSGDDGANWKYWNGSSWTAATLATEANSSSTINVNIASFTTSTNQIKWKAFFVSNGSQQVGLSSVVIDYTPNNRPVITSISPIQQTDDGQVRFNSKICGAGLVVSSFQNLNDNFHSSFWF